MLGRHKGGEGKGRSGYTADYEGNPDHGLSAYAATSPATPRVLPGTGSSGPVPNERACWFYLFVPLPRQWPWNASLFSEASGAPPSKKRRGVVIGCALS